MTGLVLLLATALAVVPGTPPPGPQTNEHFDYWARTVKTHSMKLVRKNAARVLGSLGNRQAVPTLTEVLSDPEAEVRQEAAHSLGLLGDEAALPALYELLGRESDREVRNAAGGAVSRIKAYQEFLAKKKSKKSGTLVPDTSAP